MVELVGAGAVGGTRTGHGVRARGRPVGLVDRARGRGRGPVLAARATSPNKTYLPHLTLARCKRRTDMSAAVEAVGRDPIGEPWLVDRVTVFESRTLREGAVHTARGEIVLRILEPNACSL